MLHTWPAARVFLGMGFPGADPATALSLGSQTGVYPWIFGAGSALWDTGKAVERAEKSGG